jgi:hypothetical protein
VLQGGGWGCLLTPVQLIHPYPRAASRRFERRSAGPGMYLATVSSGDSWNDLPVDCQS